MSKNKSIQALDVRAELDELLSDNSIVPTLGFLDLDREQFGARSTPRRIQPKSDLRQKQSTETADDAPQGAKQRITTEPSSRSSEITTPSGGTTPPGVTTPPEGTAGPGGATQSGRVTPPDASADRGTYSQAAPQHRRKVRDQQLAQDGHSSTENAIYDFAWRHPRAVVVAWADDAKAVPKTKKLRIGKRGIGKGVRLDVTNVMSNVQRLIDKLSFDAGAPEVTNSGTPREYIVWSYSAILERRSAVGMVRYIRTPQRGVQFVNADGSPFNYKEARKLLESMVKEPSGDVPPGGVTPPHPGGTAQSAPGCTAPSGGGSTVTPQLERSLVKKISQSSTVDVPTVTEAYLSYVAHADDVAIGDLIRTCSELLPDLRTDELVEAIHAKGFESARSLSRAEHPARYFNRLVTGYFEGESGRIRRELSTTQAAERDLKEAQETACARVEKWLDELPTENPWTRILSFLSGRVDKHRFDTWLRSMRFAGISNGVLTVRIPTEDWREFAARFDEQIKAAIEHSGAPIQSVSYLTSDEIFRRLGSTEP